jgi:hypothetical protein
MRGLVFLCVSARVRTQSGEPCIWVHVCMCAGFLLSSISTNHPYINHPTPVAAPLNTAMVSQAMVHGISRPSSLRVVSYPVWLLA